MTYCAYCGRVAHRCACARPDSPAQRFFARRQQSFAPQWMATSYKRGVPPQIKRRERAIARRHYNAWYQALIERDGPHCLNCGASINAETGDNAVELVVDHIISIAKGGKSELGNLQLLCRECNNLKGKLCIDCRQW